LKLFFDTSAFIKLFIDEKGSSSVRKLAEDYDNELYVLSLVRLESLSAICRRARNREISPEMMRKFIKSMDDILKYWHVEQLTEVVVDEAESLIKNYGYDNGLRALDALHLAAFTLNAESEWRFVCSDSRLCSAAETLGYKIINPVNDES